MNLTPEHIKYATVTQLSKLIGKDPSTICHWNYRNFDIGKLKIHYHCIDHETLTIGLIRRKAEAKKVREFQEEFDRILESSEKLDTAISA